MPCITTIQASEFVVNAMEALREETLNVESLQKRFANEGSRRSRAAVKLVKLGYCAAEMSY